MRTGSARCALVAIACVLASAPSARAQRAATDPAPTPSAAPSATPAPAPAASAPVVAPPPPPPSNLSPAERAELLFREGVQKIARRGRLRQLVRRVSREPAHRREARDPPEPGPLPASASARRRRRGAGVLQHAAAWASENNQADRKKFATEHGLTLSTQLSRVQLKLPMEAESSASPSTANPSRPRSADAVLPGPGDARGGARGAREKDAIGGHRGRDGASRVEAIVDIRATAGVRAAGDAGEGAGADAARRAESRHRRGGGGQALVAGVRNGRVSGRQDLREEKREIGAHCVSGARAMRPGSRFKRRATRRRRCRRCCSASARRRSSPEAWSTSRGTRKSGVAQSVGVAERDVALGGAPRRRPYGDRRSFATRSRGGGGGSRGSRGAR